MGEVPNPRATGRAWKDTTGYSVGERPHLLLVWQDDPDTGRVFLVPHHMVPLDWLETLTFTEGCYLESDQEYGINDTVTSTIRLVGVMVWPERRRLPKARRLPFKHTEMSYSTKQLSRAWGALLVRPSKFDLIDRDRVALVVRTGRAPPREPFRWGPGT